MIALLKSETQQILIETLSSAPNHSSLASYLSSGGQHQFPLIVLKFLPTFSLLLQLL